MNKDHLKGTWNDIKGKVKEEIGHRTGDTSTEAEGFGDRIKGRVQEGIGDLKDSLKEGADRVLDKDRDRSH